MDLSIKIKDSWLNVRVAGIVKTPKGFLFEKRVREDGEYLFLVGGRVMLHEKSEDSLKRELKEELDMKVNKFKLVGLLENFYLATVDNKKVHEICFMYEVKDVFRGKIPENFIEVSKKDLKKYDIRPKTVIKFLK